MIIGPEFNNVDTVHVHDLVGYLYIGVDEPASRNSIPVDVDDLVVVDDDAVVVLHDGTVAFAPQGE